MFGDHGSVYWFFKRAQKDKDLKDGKKFRKFKETLDGHLVITR
jgi:hypothetical protein